MPSEAMSNGIFAFKSITHALVVIATKCLRVERTASVHPGYLLGGRMSVACRDPCATRSRIRADDARREISG